MNLDIAIAAHRVRYKSFSTRELTNALVQSVVEALRSRVDSPRWHDAIAREQALKAEIEERLSC